MDFGIARIFGAPTLTAAGEVVGTLAYMSPEQADGELAGPPTDVYSLALTALRVLGRDQPGREPQPGADRAPDRRHDPAPPRASPRAPRGARRHDRRLPRARARAAPRATGAARMPARRAPGARLEHPAARSLRLRGRARARRPDRPRADRSGSGVDRRTRGARSPGRRPGPRPGPRRARRPVAGRRRDRGLARASRSRRCSPPSGPGRLGGARARPASTARARVALGAGAWAWLLAASVALGAGPELGIGSPAAVRLGDRLLGRRRPVLSPLLAPAVAARRRRVRARRGGARLGAARPRICPSRCSGRCCGRLGSTRRSIWSATAPWAAIRSALVAAGAVAVAIEFGLPRAAEAELAQPPGAPGGRRALSGRLA